MTAFDSSPAMVRLARQRLGRGATLLAADLTKPLPFADGEFDDVVASLVLHYFRDWAEPLAELRRVLKQRGRLILSVNHPIVYRVVYPEADYFAITQHAEEHTFNGQTTKLTYWHRPLHVMTDAFNRADFRVSVISEPPFSTETPRDLLPPNLRDQSLSLLHLLRARSPVSLPKSRLLNYTRDRRPLIARTCDSAARHSRGVDRTTCVARPGLRCLAGVQEGDRSTADGEGPAAKR
ncbi:MAG: hypothetical protein QOH50_639 [Kribbellaceae bacterium]|jgi:SAM-dependent methyltransferase|nr:hypothetical protein [Kribbellaceae bacterium]